MLTKLRKDENRKGHSIYLCVCGNEKSIRNDAVNSGRTKSCGCHRAKTSAQNGKAAITHGKTNSKEYVRWRDLKYRSDIPVCKEWEDFSVFWEFIKEKWEAGYTGLSVKVGATEINEDTLVLTTPSLARLNNIIRTSSNKIKELNNED